VLIRRLLKAKEATIATITSERIKKDQAQDFIEWMTMGSSDFTLAYAFWAFRHHDFGSGEAQIIVPYQRGELSTTFVGFIHSRKKRAICSAWDDSSLG
jgi:hypothetical protein